MAAIHAPRAVRSTLNYYSPSSHEEPEILYPGTAGYYRRNWDVRPVSVHNIRTADEEFTLDKQGFEIVSHHSSEVTYLDEARIQSIVYPEAIQIIKKATSATTVIPISHLVRRQSHAATVLSGRDLPDSTPIPTPTSARYVHIDQSPLGARQILDSTLPSPLPPHLSSAKRWAIINVWRPIGRPVDREPIALCDARTVADADLHFVRMELPPKGSSNGSYNVSGGSGFETCLVTANGSHRWWYAEGLTPEEVVLIKIFDSAAKEGRTGGTPHSAFEGSGEEGRPARESVEVRCLVFWKKAS